MDWLHDYDEFSAAKPEGDWVPVGRKKGKKTKNGVKSSQYSLHKEVIDATGQESWWAEPTLDTTPPTSSSLDQLDEIDSLPLRPSKTPNYDKYIQSLTAQASRLDINGHQGPTFSHVPHAAKIGGGGNTKVGQPSSGSGWPTSSNQKSHTTPAQRGNFPASVEKKGLPPVLPSFPFSGSQVHSAVSQPGYPNFQQLPSQPPPSQPRTSTAGHRPIGQPPLQSQQGSRADIVQSRGVTPPAGHTNSGFAAPLPTAGNHSPFKAPKVPQGVPQSRPPPPLLPDPVPVPPPVPSGLRPWLESYEFKLACALCFTKRPDKHGVDAYRYYQWPNHKCNGDTLVCRLRGPNGDPSPNWGILRPIANPNFLGTFRRCAQFQQGVTCRVGYMSCHFAHSDEEMELWDAERNGDFVRAELVSYLLASSRGQRPPSRAPTQTERQTGNIPNTLQGRTVAPVRHPQQVLNGPAQKYPYQGASPQQGSNSTSQSLSHQGVPSGSHIPHQVPGSSSQRLPYPGVPDTSRQPQQAPSTPNQRYPYQGAPSANQSAFQTSNGHGHSTPRLDDTTHERIPAFRHPLKIVCRECFDSGRHSFVSDDCNGCGSPERHRWKETRVVISTPSGLWVKAAPRPAGLYSYTKVRMCKSGSSCTYENFSRVPCSYAHSEEEVELWTYQADHDLKTIEEVIQVGQRSRSPDKVSLESFIPVTVTKQLKNKSRWKYRDPPFVRSGIFKRCRHDLHNRCQYSQATPNFCRFAHSDAELEEWKQRHQHERQRRQPAAPAPTITAEMLRGDIARGPLATDHPGPMPPDLKSTAPGVGVEKEAPPIVIDPMGKLTALDVERLKVVMPVQANLLSAQYTHQWRFAVHPKHVAGLNQVCFLPGSYEQHFKMSWSKSANGMLVFVTFASSVPGFFQQPLFFDFAPQQSFRIFLTAFVGGDLLLDEESPNQDGEEEVDRFTWNSVNSEIVPYSTASGLDPLYERLMRDYPPPPDQPVAFAEGEGFFEDSYKVYLHKLIQLEERGCNEKISKYYGLHEMDLVADIREIGAYTSAPSGELFGKIEVAKHLVDNSDASQIVANSVNFVLLKFGAPTKVVHQAQIFRETAVYQSDEVIYVKIGARCVEREKLEAGSKLTVQLQFQLNRVTFCLLHYGVDHFNVPELAFPRKDHGPRFLSVKKTELEDMNARQESAARYIVGAGRDRIFYPGPTLIVGPYGTGKTHTIAKIITRLLEAPEGCKILIATHTNSAADWYITEYLHPYLKLRRNNNRSHLVRVYAHDIVNLNRINQAIQDNYVLSEGDKQPVEKLRKPTLADMLRCSVVVTTLASSIHLVEIPELRGMFTHIFIDEAGQALEPEVMIPLGLAGPRTVVALAGDHKQMRPKVHTRECHERLLHRSMLERLNTASRIMKFRNTCLLSFNYRLRPEILNFITKFYDGDPLRPMAKHLRHPDYYPLTFMEVKGLDQKRGASYINAIEAQSLVSAIQSLVASWPTQKWGSFDAKNICVLAPYTPQVKHLRTLLRAKQLGGVTVERVQNVQGKQFRVVFISTVRTRNTLKPGEEQQKGDEGFYHGFLSEEGEIIAACTRAQSLLYVVGDPVALCSVGECQRVWRSYLQECEENNSLLPEGTTVDRIKNEIEGLLQRADEGVPSAAAENEQQFNPYGL